MDSDGSSTVVLTVSSSLWRDAFDALEPLTERVVKATLDEAVSTPWLMTGEVSLLLADDQEIRALNATYRSRDRATNVLSFPSLDLVEGTSEATPQPGPVLLGDVAISIERMRAEAKEQQKTIEDHFAHLLVHGVLHLLGYDHVDDGQAEVMEALETKVLETLGFAAPYMSRAEAQDLSVVT